MWVNFKHLIELLNEAWYDSKNNAVEGGGYLPGIIKASQKRRHILNWG